MIPFGLNNLGKNDMLQRLLVLVAIVLGTSEMDAQETKFTDLFNGKDLSGWKLVGAGDNWLAKDGELQCTGKPGAHWIRTEKEYSDFELRLEFKMNTDGNSGVFIRAPEAGTPWVEGLEVQLLDDFGPKWKNLKPDQFTASIYAVEGPSKRVTKPAGQWQSMRIVCNRRALKVWVNGVQVVDADLDKYLDRADKVPGIKRQAGFIGFQDHGDAVSFRKIKIAELK
ncbi:MAG: hypothetical protein ACI9G1_003322 [Pirellulaceae bacterium]